MLSVLASVLAVVLGAAEVTEFDSDLAKARVDAAKNDRYVLVVRGEGGAADGLRAALRKDRDLRDKVLYEYDVVHVDGGAGALEISDPTGAAVARSDLSAFSIAGALDAAGLLAFLKEHQPERRSASKILKAAKARAKAENKRVFVHFGAPWCGNCHELEHWMAQADVAPLLAKEFVDCKIDIDRTKRGRALLDKTRTGEPGGIPWFAFFGPDGEKLIESNRASDGKNVGFPRGEANHVHVRKMLEAGTIHLTEDEITRLIASLP